MAQGPLDLEGMIESEEPFDQNPEEESLFEGQYGIEFEGHVDPGREVITRTGALVFDVESLLHAPSPGQHAT